MKAKTFIFLLAVLIVAPMNAVVNLQKRKPRVNKHLEEVRAVTRSPINYIIDVSGDETCLQIMLRFPLSDADITITDKDGNTVVYEPQTSGFGGKVFYIHTPKAYPYMIEISSPAVDIVGEIVLE
ncbi:uncharacterized protein DUF3244 [Bacteroides zoogleoformans]|uniref:DUF3244 domain-containing protein n=1 Tax=Bacteroides zoogleoformans TaxID=28119 RepID=A0ABN5IMP6_9BACE|nr:DUF3244 domain-containing protein [Bacteroides zoogleoformans]AVM53480.1 DUF3244 domain-containing protein [Bacteroides zoogleoformans]TWJ17456.1 uncharacterized protein DUF3244 [Bacteroides zoogleoformans]